VELKNNPFWTMPEEVRQLLIDLCERVYGQVLGDVYDKTRFVLYCLVDLREELFPDSHEHWNDRDFSNQLGIHFGQVSRYRRRKDWPSLQTAEQWLRRLGRDFPGIPTDGIYDAIAIGFAEARWAHEIALSTSPGVRPSRAPLKGLDIDGVDQARVALAHILSTPGPIHKQWLYQLERHHSDWDASIDDPMCDQFLTELLTHVERLFGKVANKPWFAAVANVLLDIDLDLPSERQKVRDLVRTAWNGPERTIQLDPASPLFPIFGEVWSHPVALFVTHHLIFDR